MTSASVQPPVPCLAASVCTARPASLSVTMSRNTVVAPRRIHCGRGHVAVRAVKSEKSVQLLCPLFLFIKKKVQQELSLGRGAGNSGKAIPLTPLPASRRRWPRRRLLACPSMARLRPKRRRLHCLEPQAGPTVRRYRTWWSPSSVPNRELHNLKTKSKLNIVGVQSGSEPALPRSMADAYPWRRARARWAFWGESDTDAAQLPTASNRALGKPNLRMCWLFCSVSAAETG